MEVELKLVLSPEGADALLATGWPGGAPLAALPLAATYFDTPDQHLRHAGYALRIRDEGGRKVQTVKATGEAAGLFARPEWECESDGPALRLDTAAGPLGALLPAATIAALAPVFITDVERLRTMHARDGATVEIAIDRGTVTAGDRQGALCEIEFELGEGTPAALFALAREVDAITPARLGVLTKSERGYALLDGRARKAVKAAPVTLDPDGPTGAGFATIAHACLRQFRLNEDLLAQRHDAAALHQARVGLRRLRSAFSLFKALFAADSQGDRLRGELRWLQGVLGGARDIDVLAARLDDEGAVARLELARAEAYAAVDAALASARTRTLMLDLVEWLALGAWATGDGAAEPIGRTAAAILDRHRRRVRKRGRQLATLDDHDRHQVRIEAKKLRYASEFFAGLYVSTKARRRQPKFAAALEALQDRLGTLNDLAAAPAVMAALGLEAPPPSPQDIARLLDQAGDAHEELADAKPFWR